MNDKTYNGWSNYETWTVSAWLGNDEGAEAWIDKRIEDVIGTCLENDGDQETAASALGDDLAGRYGGDAPELRGMYSDLLTAALGAVDWDEIAAGYIAGRWVDMETEWMAYVAAGLED